MAENIFQTGITPVKPKILSGERIFVYVPEATYTTKGIASYNTNHFNINNGNVTLNLKYLSEAPFDRESLIILDKADFLFVNGKTQINWPYAYNNSGSTRANGSGLIKVAPLSANYLKFTEDENHYLSVDIDKLSIDVLKPAITEHNNSPTAHPSIRKLIDDNRDEMIGITDLLRNEKVNKIAGNYYIQNTETGITIGYPKPSEGASGIYDFKGIKITNDEVRIGDYVTGAVSMGAYIYFAGSKAHLHQYNEFSGDSDSPLATEEDVQNAINTRVEKTGTIEAENKTYTSTITNGKNNITVLSRYTSADGNANNEVKLTPTAFTLNGKQIAVEEYVNNKVAEVTSIQIRNKKPNLTIEATEDTVQTIATQYIVDNYNRQPQMNDGLFIVRTDKNNDTMEYAYFNNTWINTGLNGVDLSNYVDKSSMQTITGHKDFTGILTKNGVDVATIDDITVTDENAHKVLILGANGTIGTNANFVVEDAESYIPYRNNLTEFIFSGIIPVTGEIDLTKEVTIDFGDTSYYLFDAVDIGRKLTLGDLDFALKESLVTGYNYLFRTVFFSNEQQVGFAVLPDKEDVLSLNSDQMDNYMADGGLPNGQLAICNKVITNGYTEGGMYRFKITYPNTYEWEELLPFVKVDNISVIKAADTTLSAISLKDGVKDTTDNTLNNFSGVVRMKQIDYERLVMNGTVEINGVTYTYDPGTIYDTGIEDNGLQTLTLTQSGSVLTSSETFNTHVQILLEFETDGVHYGADFILHPYDSAICLVSYSFATYTNMAYLNDNGNVNIMVPEGLTITNIKAHYIELGE